MPVSSQNFGTQRKVTDTLTNIGTGKSACTSSAVKLQTTRPRNNVFGGHRYGGTRPYRPPVPDPSVVIREPTHPMVATIGTGGFAPYHRPIPRGRLHQGVGLIGGNSPTSHSFSPSLSLSVKKLKHQSPRIIDFSLISFVWVGDSSHRYVSHPIHVLFPAMKDWISHVDYLDEFIVFWNFFLILHVWIQSLCL
jgi:hypothetical protein